MARGAKNGSAEARIRRAFQAFLGGDLAGAEHELTEIVRADSNDSVAYLTLAHLYRERGEVGRALRIHQNLLLRSDLEPELRSRVQSALAADLRAGGFRERAIAAYEEVLSAEPKRADAIEALVALHVEGGDFPAAIEVQHRMDGWFRSADPQREAELVTAMARHEHSEGRVDAARKLARKAAKLDPNCAAAHLLLGDIESERGKSKAALAAWSQAVTAASSAAADNAASGGAGNPDTAEAIDATDEIWGRIESAHAALPKGDGGEAFARKHLESHPGDAAARRALARVLVGRGEVDAGLAELRGLLDVDPTDQRSRAQLGKVLLDEKREADALDAYRDWIEAQLNSPRTSGVESDG